MEARNSRVKHELREASNSCAGASVLKVETGIVHTSHNTRNVGDVWIYHAAV